MLVSKYFWFQSIFKTKHILTFKVFKSLMDFYLRKTKPRKLYLQSNAQVAILGQVYKMIILFSQMDIKQVT